MVGYVECASDMRFLESIQVSTILRESVCDGTLVCVSVLNAYVYLCGCHGNRTVLTRTLTTSTATTTTRSSSCQ